MSRKRKLEVTHCKEEANVSWEDEFAEFYSLVCSDQQIPIETMKSLLTFLERNKENPDFQAQTRSKCNLKFLSGLLWRYNCTWDEADQILYSILEQLERGLSVDFKAVSPLVFGEKSKKYYGDLIKYGRTLHKHLTPDQVLEYFDQKRMWDTLVRMASLNCVKNEKMNKRALTDSRNFYDPRFVLRILFWLVKPGTQLNNRKMVNSNALSFCFAATSLYDSDLRAIAYAFLERCLLGVPASRCPFQSQIDL